MFTEGLLEIPDPTSISGWKEIPIIENREPLIRLNELDPRIEIGAEYYRMGIREASSIQFLRQEATERLIFASSILPPEFKLVIFDAFRPLSVQSVLFENQVQDLREQNPNLSEERLIEEAQR